MEKMYARKAFKCSICDKEYENAMDRARCELACGQRREEEAKKIAEAKKKEEQEARWAEVEMAHKHYVELYDAYLNDYEFDNYESATCVYDWIDKIIKVFDNID